MAKNINIELTKGDTETLLWTFTDSDGNAYTITDNTFTFTLGTTEGASNILSKTGGDFTLASNTATLELSVTDTNKTIGRYWYTCSFVDSNSKKTTVSHGTCIFVHERTGQSNSTSVTVGTTTLSVAMNIAYGTQDAFGSNYTASGDYIVGTGAATIQVQSNNFSGTSAPDSDDDNDEGYIVGSRWIDVTNDKEYVCLDATVGAAVWTETTAGAAGGETNTASSQGTGTSLFYQKSGVDLQFNAIKSENDIIAVALDGVTHDIELTANTDRVLTAIQKTDLTDAGDSTLHYHATDRARANHTGTQPASTISDFDTEVSNNTNVTANTAKETNATHTGDVTGSEVLTIAADAVTYAKMQNVVSENRILGNVSGAGFPVAELTAAEVRTMINVADGATANTGTVDTSGTPVANDFAKFTDADTIEGRSYAEVKTDLSLNNVENTAISTWAGSSNVTTLGTISTGVWNGTAITNTYIDTGITDNKIVEIDDADAADNDYAKFTTAGIEGRSYAEVKTDLSLDSVENTAISTWAGTSNITTVGTIETGTWQGTAIANSYVANDLTISGGTIGDSAITLVQSAGATPTSEGVIEWDTDDDLLCIGDGSNTLKLAATKEIAIAVSDETTELTTGTAKATFRMPNYATTLVGVRCSSTTAPTGSNLIVDINESGITVLSTKLTIDASEKTSTTAATPAVISDSALAADAEITVDIDQVGSSVAGAGLKVYLEYRRA